MITARYATSSSVLCDGSHANRSVVPWARYPTPAANAVAKIPYDEHRHPDVDRQQRRVLERRDERLDLGRQRGRVEQHRERHADRDEPDLADRVALGEEQVAAEDRGRERDAELVQVPVRPAADDDRRG